MRQFHFNCERSRKPEDQIHGIDCTAAVIGGEISAPSVSEARRQIAAMCVIPGTWTLKLRCGHQWCRTTQLIRPAVGAEVEIREVT
jgi:hypothetical protein